MLTLKTVSTLGFIAFGVSLAYYVSNRLSPDALNLAIGVLCGVGASIPVSMGLLLALTRQRKSSDEDQADRYAHSICGQSSSGAQLPQVIVLAPNQGGYVQGSAPFYYPAPGPIPHVSLSPNRSEDVIDGRDWRIIGENE